MEKVVLIEPRSKRANVYQYVHLPLLGVPILGEILRREGHEVEAHSESYSRIEPSKLEADIVGVSILTPTALRGYEILDHFRKRGIRTMVGGPHATFMPEEALEHADYVCLGEGENVVADIVEGKVDPGIVKGGNVDFATTPIPNLSLIINKKKGSYLSRAMDNGVHPVMASRGCPRNCSFCSVKMMFGRKYRTRPVESILEEIDRSGAKVFFFIDDNFGMDKKVARDLLEKLIGRNVKWSAQVETSSDKEFLQLMSRAGCNYVFTGFESVNPATLHDYGKKQDIAKMELFIKNAHDAGISVHGMFVIGSDNDTPKTIDKTVEFSIRNNLETVQYLIWTPLPGAEDRTVMEREGRILHNNWEKYDAHHAVFQPNHFSPSELEQGALNGMRKFYSYRRTAGFAYKAIKEFFKGDTNNWGDSFWYNKERVIYGLMARHIIRKWRK